MLNSLDEKAKKELADFAEELYRHLENYWDDEINRNFGFNEDQRTLVKKMLEHSKEHDLIGGKRIRGAFVHYGYRLGGMDVNESIWHASESVELVHTALLMHDDFMDEDKLRRGKQTTHEFFAEGDKHYGDAMAVCTGDAVLCLGFELLLSCGMDEHKVGKAMKQFLRGIANTAYGQGYDITLPKGGRLTEEKVMDLHKAKTAIYTYENPLFIGAILAGLDQNVLNVLHEYSMKGGVAFQLQDDILGMYGDEAKTGKSANSDLLQGKSTLLIAKALEGTEDQKQSVLGAWGNKDASSEQISAAKTAIKESGSYDISVRKARELAEEAVNEARKLRKMNLNDEAIDFLEGIAEYMVKREV